jgi:peptidoglycan/LPS O-acetylase OafA/YrhL
LIGINNKKSIYSLPIIYFCKYNVGKKHSIPKIKTLLVFTSTFFITPFSLYFYNMKHMKQIDGLRCIAIIMVLLTHFASSINYFLSVGYYGVDLFFTISGFLITSILINSKEPFFKSYKKFLGRRTLRIFPLYYVAILVLYLAQHPFVQQYLFYFLSYTYNYARVKYSIPSNSASHYWSLGVEEQFYLFWPIVVLLLRKHLKLLIAIIVVLVVACFLQMVFNMVHCINPYNTYGLIPRAGSLGIGALGAVLTYINKLPHKLLSNKLAEYILLVVLATCLITHSNLKYPILAICSTILVLKASTNNYKIQWLNQFLFNKKIGYIGSISYGIYVVHFPLAQYVTEYVFNPFFWNKIHFASLGKWAVLQYHSWLIKLPLYSFLSIVLAHYSFTYFEQPILKLKDKYFA